jgi:hypothetical protein
MVRLGLEVAELTWAGDSIAGLNIFKDKLRL